MSGKGPKGTDNKSKSFRDILGKGKSSKNLNQDEGEELQDLPDVRPAMQADKAKQEAARKAKEEAEKKTEQSKADELAAEETNTVRMRTAEPVQLHEDYLSEAGQKRLKEEGRKKEKEEAEARAKDKEPTEVKPALTRNASVIKPTPSKVEASEHHPLTPESKPKGKDEAELEEQRAFGKETDTAKKAKTEAAASHAEAQQAVKKAQQAVEQAKKVRVEKRAEKHLDDEEARRVADVRVGLQLGRSQEQRIAQRKKHDVVAKADMQIEADKRLNNALAENSTHPFKNEISRLNDYINSYKGKIVLPGLKIFGIQLISNQKEKLKIATQLRTVLVNTDAEALARKMPADEAGKAKTGPVDILMDRIEDAIEFNKVFTGSERQQMNSKLRAELNDIAQKVRNVTGRPKTGGRTGGQK